MSKEEYQDRIEKLMDLGYSNWDAKLAVEAELEWERNAATFNLH